MAPPGRPLSLCVAALLTAGLLGAAAPPAAAVQDTALIAFDLLDYAQDVNHGFTVNRTALHEEVDLLSIGSALQGADVRFELKVRGALVADNASWRYGWSVFFGPIDWSHPAGEAAYAQFANVTLTFSNGSATFREGFDAPVNVTVVSAAASQLRVSAPLALFSNFTDTWLLEGSAHYAGNGTWFDEADLDPGGGALFPGDATADPANFTSPTVAITSLLVQGQGPLFRLTVNGTTAGAVSELRVAVGDKSDFGGIVIWSWSGWWREEGKDEQDSNVTLEKVGGSWSSWNFVRDFDPAVYSYGLVSLTKVEVRGIAADGSWGHANQTCACGTSSGPIPAPGGNAGTNNTQNNTTGGSNGAQNNTTGGSSGAQNNTTGGSNGAQNNTTARTNESSPRPTTGFLPGAGALAAGLGIAAAALLRRPRRGVS